MVSDSRAKSIAVTIIAEGDDALKRFCQVNELHLGIKISMICGQRNVFQEANVRSLFKWVTHKCSH